MNLHVFCIHISIMLLLQYALSKSLPANLEIDSIIDDSEINDSSDDDTESIHETNHRFKHLRNYRLKGHIRKRRASEQTTSMTKQCAVMYKNDEPVGILQPYRDSYQFLPIHSDEHVPVDISPYADVQVTIKRDTEDDEDSPELGDETLKKGEENSQFSDDRYPYIFAKFKIDSKIEKPYSSGSKQRALHKRESVESLADEKRSNSLKSTLSRIQDEGAEVELRNILSDMGLIDDVKQHVDKREAELNEDEDLEHGTNKINLIKLDNTEDRSKREDEGEEKPVKRSDTVTKHYESIEIPEPKTINQEEYIDQYLNKNEDQPQKQVEKKAVEKRSDDAAAQMEREIKSKLQKIKEEVRSEIEKIKGGNTEEFEDNGEEDEEQKQEKEKSQRKKRHVISTLVEEETRDIDPVLNADKNLIPHIRRIRKRSLTEEDVSHDETEDTIKELKISENDGNLVDSNSKKAFESSKGLTNSEDMPSCKRHDSIKKSKRSENKAELVGSNFKNPNDSTKINLAESTLNDVIKGKTETNLIIDLNPEIDSTQKSNSLGRPKRYISKKSIGTGYLPYEFARTANQYYATTEKHFLTRDLKEYDEESINDDDNANVEETNEKSDTLGENILNRGKRSCKCTNGDKDCKCGKSFDDESTDNDNTDGNSEESNEEEGKSSLNKEANVNIDAGPKRDKKSCKCNNGDKDCKCGKAPVRLLKGTDGVNFVYIDDVPRLADGAPSFKVITDQTENHVKMNLRPIPLDKKRSAKETLNYQKTMANFAKNLRDGGYTLDIDPDVYRITEENSKSVASRRKRNSFADLVAIHGGGPIMDHLIAIRERSMLPRIRVKRNAKTKDQQLTLADMSDNDLFGALPQSFEGELARFKRVKRAN